MELEAILTVTALHVLNYYYNRRFRRLLARLGMVESDVDSKCAKIARMELFEVDFDMEQWYQKYGSKLKGH